MTSKLTFAALSVCAALTLGGCAQQSPVASAPQTEQAKQSESEKANALFESIFMENVMASPISQTYLGIKQDQDKWDDFTEAAYANTLARNQRHLAQLNGIDDSQLDPQTQLSYRLMKQRLEQSIEDHQWRHHSYPINQMYGYQSTTASFLINQHRINDVADAQAYISRLNGIEKRFDQLIEQLSIREAKGIVAPRFVFPYAISDSRNILSGAPFEAGADSTLFADFKAKVTALPISDDEKAALVQQAQDALKGPVANGYGKLIAFLEGQHERASEDAGVWKFPDGERFYNNALSRTTTTGFTAAEIHQLGLDDVARIHDEMRAIRDKVGFEGDLQAFFAFMRTDSQFYLDNDEAGRAAYLGQAERYIGDMNQRLDEVFGVKPKAPLVVKKVEAFREKSAGKAFYQQPAPDGSRPGFFYANLYDMQNMPTYQLEALAFHEGIPGHHMQIAIAQELEGLPKFRRFGGYTAYVEGWGLYSEYLPKEMGFYQDPYSDFGRLAMELWRACRLVVDTGIHAKGWTREQAIDYLAQNTPNPQGDVVKAIERYIVMPSQATAYKVGMMQLLELRAQAKAELGEQFDLRGFHDVVLANGPLPLNVLGEQVSQWVESEKVQL
ncbi:DUF885 domain-containing protein [Ferrimonas balearica]|uniref:DUF885 domain-containing protein n=1 Tax=Ferrimonas balearica TaxID=44012 RepID=UPI001C9A0380|nr:DUF885 domain-containing protein [Ferrimonas balearica]MBY5921799.1 DUF885 domain-containing protein [Ferrimonas balearica]MBY5994861.1 DUF885 domain-containing protein [Ferrimonas balearica]